MHTYGLRVKRETVYFLLKLADPEGIARRRANVLKRRDYDGHGPNWILHVDGYDKLKHYGFCIHGAIDGFSRYVKWLRTATTNNNPRVTARYFLESVIETGGVSRLVRVDCGTENVSIGTLQTSLRALHDDSLAGERSFITGRSVHNQRIEALWGQVRKHSMNYYIEFFKSMKEDGLFNGRQEEIECLQFCFGPLIQNDLDETRELWNKHQIRKQRDKVHHGKPYSMYHLPEFYGTQDYTMPVNREAVDVLMDTFTEEPHIYEPAFAQRAHAAIPGLATPTSPVDVLDLYCRLKLAMGI